jgi:hypothetical protein
VASHAEWSLELTLADIEAPPCRGDGSVAVDLGWRQVAATADELAARRNGPDHAIRVARWIDDDGTAGELRLPPELLGGLTKPEGIRAVRDRAFDAARATFAQWLETATDVPDWLREATATIARWQSCARLAYVTRRWVDEGVAPEHAKVHAALEAWRYHDWHLWHYESHQRKGAHRRRKDLYRVTAARLAERYATLVIEDFDLRRLARRAPVEDDVGADDIARSNRHLVATSELRSALLNAFASRGGDVVTVAAEWTTQWCAECEALGEENPIERFDAAAAVMHRCQRGHVWDQDTNAARNILRRSREQPGGDDSPGGARGGPSSRYDGPDGESRWARARRLRAERTARLDTARGVEVS